MAKRVCFYDLPGELRNRIYEIYAAQADKTTVAFARGRYVPPALALVSHRVRGELLSYWDSQDHLCLETRHLRLAAFDLDYRPGVEFWSKAMEIVQQRQQNFESVRITLVFTRSWDGAQARRLLHEFVDWFLTEDHAITAAGDEHWEVLDHRRFGRLKQLRFLLSATAKPILRKWRSLTPRNIRIGVTVSIDQWWRGQVRGARGGRRMK